MSFSWFKPSSTACLITLAAIFTLTSRTSVTSGRRPAPLPVSTGAVEARALTAATIRDGVRSRVRERTAPRPMPGKVTELLHSAVHATISPHPLYALVYLQISCSSPSNLTGGKGLPVATKHLPLVQSNRSCGFASCSLVGLDRGNITGRSTCLAISSTISFVNAPGTVEVPIRTCGLTSLTTESNPLCSFPSQSLSSRA